MSFFWWVVVAIVGAIIVPLAGRFALKWPVRRSYAVIGLITFATGLVGVILVGGSDWVGVFLLGTISLILSVAVPFIGGMFSEFLDDQPGIPV